MKLRTTHVPRSEGLSACLAALGILGSVLLGLLLFSQLSPSPQLHMLLFLLAQPLALNLILLVHIPVPGPGLESGSGKGLRGRFSRLWHRSRRGFCRLLALLSRHRDLLAAALFLGTLLGIYRHLFRHRPAPAPAAMLVPALLLSVFFTLLVVEHWLQSVVRELSRQDRFLSILRNLRYQVHLVKFLFLGSALVSALPLLHLPDLWKPLYDLLFFLLGLQSLEALSLFLVRFIRRELDTNPDLRLLARDRTSLAILSHLEETSGLTLRSLWSLHFIKSILPYGLLLFLFLLWFSTGVVQVGSGQQGALYRLGRLEERILTPGLHLVLPWPFDSVTVCDTDTLREMTIGYESTAIPADNLWTETHGGEEGKYLLGNGNELVSINLRLEYRISDLRAYLTCNSDPEALLRSAAYEAVTANTISTDLETLLDVDRRAFSRQFQADLTRRVEDYDTGLLVENVILESIHPPVEVAEVYQRIISAEIMAEKYILESEAWAEVLVKRARDTCNTDINAAIARSHGRIAEATAAVAAFNASREAEDLYGSEYRNLKYMQAITEAYAHARIIIVDGDIDSAGLFFGHLPK